MTADQTADRVLVDAIRDLPTGLRAQPLGPADVEELTALMRAVDIAGCGHTSTNADEVRDGLAAPDCGWGHGAAGVWRDDELVGALVTYDGLPSGRGWMMELYPRPGDPRGHGIAGALVDAGLREGRARFDLRFADPDQPMQQAKAGAYANDGVLRAEIEERGFREVRRYWRMTADHWSMDSLAEGGAGGRLAAAAQADAAGLGAQGYLLRPFRDDEDDWHAVHEVLCTAFLDHFDFTPVDEPTWRDMMAGQTEDQSQWLVVEHDGRPVAYALGSNRYAAEDCGYVASIGVLREHRGRGVARALLRARMAEDARRGHVSTILHVDATNPTGATALYESVGFVADSEFVGFYRPLYG